MLDSPMLVDQNMVCRSNTDQIDHFPRIHLDVSLFSGIHQACIPTFPFDSPTQNDTFYRYILGCVWVIMQSSMPALGICCSLGIQAG